MESNLSCTQRMTDFLKADYLLSDRNRKTRDRVHGHRYGMGLKFERSTEVFKLVVRKNRLTHAHKYLLFFVRWGVKSTIKTKFQFEFARLVPYGPLTRTMWTLEFTAHATERTNKGRACANGLRTTNLKTSVCKSWTLDWTMECVFGLS